MTILVDASHCQGTSAHSHPRTEQYKYIETVSYFGDGCKDKLASPLTGITATSCVATAPTAAQCKSVPATKTSTKTSCVNTNGDPFAKYGSGLWTGLSTSKSGCGDIYSTSSWTFTVSGVCNVYATPTKGFRSFRLVGCASFSKQAVYDYYVSADCSGIPKSSTTIQYEACSGGGFFSKGYTSQVCIEAPRQNQQSATN